MILFLVPYVPIPRIMKRITTASDLGNCTVVYWDRGTDVADNLKFPSNMNVHHIDEKANEGNPLKRISATLKFCKKAYKILKKEKPSCIHVTKTDMLFLVWLYSKIQKVNPKVIYEISDIHKMALNESTKISDIAIKSILAFIESIGCKIVDHLIVTSESFWTKYYYKWISKEKVIFIPNTPQESVFSSYKKKDNGKYCIGFIGKIRYIKQLKMLIDAARKAKVNVLIAGNGVDLNKIEKYCDGMKNVNIYGAYDYKTEIARLYEKVDCIFSMYDTEIKNVQIALPNRLYEAAFCQLPLIVSKGTELANIVESEGIGISVADGDSEALTNTLIKLKNDNRYNEEFIKNCKNFSEKWKYERANEVLIKTYKGCN